MPLKSGQRLATSWSRLILSMHVLDSAATLSARPEVSPKELAAALANTCPYALTLEITSADEYDDGV